MNGKEAKQRLEKQYKRQNEHIKETYDRVSVTLPKGTKERIKAKGESINGYITRLVLADLDATGKTYEEEIPDFIRDWFPKYRLIHHVKNSEMHLLKMGKCICHF